MDLSRLPAFAPNEVVSRWLDGMQKNDYDRERSVSPSRVEESTYASKLQSGK